MSRIFRVALLLWALFGFGVATPVQAGDTGAPHGPAAALIAEALPGTDPCEHGTPPQPTAGEAEIDAAVDVTVLAESLRPTPLPSLAQAAPAQPARPSVLSPYLEGLRRPPRA